MTHVVEHPDLTRGLPVADVGRALAAAVLAGLIREGQVLVSHGPNCIDFIGTPADRNGIAVRVQVSSDRDQVARWLNIPRELITTDVPDGE